MIAVLPFTSLVGATGVGTGIEKDLEEVLSSHAVIVAVTGSPGTMNVALEGSHDGAVWTTLATASGSGPTAAAFVEGRPVRYVRANLTVLSGGSSPAVTATVASSS